MTETATFAVKTAAGLAIHQVVLSDGHGLEREVDPVLIEATLSKAGLKHQGWRRIDRSEIPTDRSFRAAWRDTGKIDVNMAAARIIARDRIRAARKAMFENLDNAIRPFDIKASMGTTTDRDRATVTALEAQRQTLRDAPDHPAIEQASTPEELSAHLKAFGA